jgi:hypothetical protein
MKVIRCRVKFSRREPHSDFTYDALNRLASAQNAGTNCAATVIGGKSEYWGNSYSFDEWENLFNETMTKCSSEYLYTTVDVNTRVHVSGTDYQYDAAGNMTNDQTDSLTSIYDQENRISSAPEMESPQPIPMTATATA